MAAYAQALSINGGLRGARVKLIRAARLAAPEVATREEAALRDIESFYPAGRR